MNSKKIFLFCLLGSIPSLFFPWIGFWTVALTFLVLVLIFGPTLASIYRKHEETNRRYRIFKAFIDHSPVSFVIADNAQICKSINELKQRGVRDFNQFFLEHTDELIRIGGSLRVLEVNDQTVELFAAPDKQTLINAIPNMVNKKTAPAMRNIIVGLAEKRVNNISEVDATAMNGEPLKILVHSQPAPGYEESWSKILLTMLNYTELNNTQKALTEEKNLLQMYLKVAPIFFLTLTREGKIQMLNKSACDTLECEESVALGKDWFDTFVPAEVRESLRRDFMDMIQDRHKGVHKCVHEILTPQGRRRRISWNQSVFRNGKDEIIGTVSTGIDITERIRAEVALRESEERFRTLFDNLGDGMLVINPTSGVVVDCNAMTCDMLGYRRNEIVGLQVLNNQFFNEITWAKVVDVIKAPSSSERDFRGVAIRRKDEKPFYGDVTVSPIQIQGQLYLIASIRDATARMHDENKSLYQAKVHTALASLLETTMKTSNEDDYAESCLKAALDMTDSKLGVIYEEGGTPQKQLLVMVEHRGKEYLHLDINDDEYCSMCVFRDMLVKDPMPVIYNRERSIPCPSPPHFNHSKMRRLIAIPFARNKMMKGMILLANKLTDFTQQDLDALTTFTSVFSEALLRKRAEAKLLEMMNRITASNEELQTFAHSISHDLQEPLNIIRSFTDVLEEQFNKDGTDELVLKSINAISRNSRRMQLQIRGLLDYSRIEAHGKAPALVDLNEIIQEVLKDMQITLEKNYVEIRVGRLPHVMGDAMQLSRVFQNLITNAVKYKKPDSNPVIEVIGETYSDNTAGVRFKDNGIGIDPKFHQEVFKIFRRLHPVDKIEGTGIGLAICKKIIERLNGELLLSSAPVIGTEFLIKLPTVKSVIPF